MSRIQRSIRQDSQKARDYRALDSGYEIELSKLGDMEKEVEREERHNLRRIVHNNSRVK